MAQRVKFDRGPNGRGGGGDFGKGTPSPSPPVSGLGERCKLPHWGPGRPKSIFVCFLIDPIKISSRTQFHECLLCRCHK